MSNDSEQLSVDEILEVLCVSQRRELLRFLRDSNRREHSLQTVIDHLRQASVESVGREYLLTVLAHVHAPILEDAGLIEYDVSDRVVRYHPNERLEHALARIEGLDQDLETLERD